MPGLTFYNKNQTENFVMDKQVADLMKDQVNKEFYSAYLYLDISNYYYEKNLDGFGHWFMLQAKEEQQHALKILKYLQDNNEGEAGDNSGPGIQFHQSARTPGRHPQARTVCYRPYSRHFQKARESDDFRSYQFMEWFGGRTGRGRKEHQRPDCQI